MFRRKEDSLFDTATDPNHEEESASTGSGPSSSASASGSSYHTGSGYGQSMPRPPGSAQPTPANTGFRSAPSAPLSADMGRNRMPEVGGKPHSPVMPVTAASPVTSSPVSAVESKASVGGKNSGSKRVLTVGNDILLKGEIATCDRLVIEGKVDATLNDVHTVEIAEHGSFKGSANIEDAEISGLFEGDLVVRNRLVIYGTGKVRGNITYGEIEIERGGELTGEIKSNASKGSNLATARKKDNKEAA